jgi:hypothetical protein
MKNLRHATTILLFAGLTSCMPGKFASGIEGVIVDSQSSNPVQGAIIESSIPHRDGDNGAAFSATTSDQNGRFSFRPVYGIYKLLMMSADWRKLTITKNGYEKSSVSVFQRDRVRVIETGGRTNRIITPRSEELKLSIKKK